jgi:hypothetical protein
MIQVMISPQSLLETGIKVEKVDNLRLFKFTDKLQSHLEDLLEKNKTGSLTLEEEVELNALGEPEYKRNLRELSKKYRNIRLDTQSIIEQLQGGNFIGDCPAIKKPTF